MTKSATKNIPASVRQRLANLAQTQKEDFQQVLSRYARERLLYRLSLSEHRDRFILKGALLFSYWTGAPHRPTRDIDFLGYDPPAMETSAKVFKELCHVEVTPDGLTFPDESVRAERIKDDEEYEGVRVHMTALLDQARITVQIDIAFGDRVVPGPEEIEFPTLLDLPGPHLRSYTRESVVAEKFEALVKLGMLNSRMKDFFDLWRLSQDFSFDGKTLASAIKATFENRKTAVPGKVPLALTAEFYDDREKNLQWNAFLNKSGLRADARSLQEITAILVDFLVPVSRAVADQSVFDRQWKPAGLWE